jgi:hypothetical protein
MSIAATAQLPSVADHRGTLLRGSFLEQHSAIALALALAL